ncbi:hypothetical protein CARUB_v10017644mg [Capsella rubella]|uniref:ZF-HD dimerization-type domain-containing protein n=1 Tax=Capsella rubella TaxID=81985 RepID=R0HGU0_9BRAS|nr:zinc-finger homeodomain protein 9 [Capsella rubella]EOA24395.1 hypothetical protein CARUB_v10017644mg [Capsella rubella]
MLEVRAMDHMTPKSPEPESETPIRIQPAKPISFSNGFIKRHHHHNVTVTYKECLKNHAAAIGGHALDGCGEFMPSPSSTPSDPTSLKCAACGCHRNFHRRDPDDSSAALPPSSLPLSSTTTAAIEYQPHHRHHPLPPPLPRSPNSSSPPPISSSYMLLALSGNNNNKTVPFSDLNFSAAAAAAGRHNNNISTTPGSRKRFRTKFSSSQKEKMHEFADKIGWKIQKRDEDNVREFCREIGVDKGVLKVWMHNNKNTFKFPGGGGGAATTGINGGEDDGVRGGSGLANDEDDGGGDGGDGGGGRFESDSGGADGRGNVNASSSSS